VEKGAVQSDKSNWIIYHIRTSNLSVLALTMKVLFTNEPQPYGQGHNDAMPLVSHKGHWRNNSYAQPRLVPIVGHDSLRLSFSFTERITHPTIHCWNPALETKLSHVRYIKLREKPGQSDCTRTLLSSVDETPAKAVAPEYSFQR